MSSGGCIAWEATRGSTASLDKLRYMPLIFDGDSLAAMHAVRRVFDPAERVNPGKVIPVHACREWTQAPSLRSAWAAPEFVPDVAAEGAA